MEKEWYKSFFNVIGTLFMGIIVFIFILKGKDLNIIKTQLSNTNLIYIMLGVFIGIIYILGESLAIGEILKIFGYEKYIFGTLKYGFIGFFFSGITPFATGGQPMQIYYMKKDGIEISHASLALLIEFGIYQLVTFIYGIISYFYIKRIGLVYSKITKSCFLFGIIINFSFLILVLICIFSKSITSYIYKIIKFILMFLKVDEEKKSIILYNIKYNINEYRKSSTYIISNKMIITKTIIIVFIQILSYFSIAYFIYLALGFKENIFLKLISIQSVISIASSYVPTPGAIGANESNFLSIYKNIYSKDLLEASLILTRTVSFYILVIVSLVVISICNYKHRKNKVDFN